MPPNAALQLTGANLVAARRPRPASAQLAVDPGRPPVDTRVQHGRPQRERLIRQAAAEPIPLLRGDAMVAFLAHLLITAALLLLVANLVPGVRVAGWGPAFLGAIVLGFVNAFVRPLMVLLTLPLTVLTLGLFLLVVNALMLGLVAVLVPGIQVRGFGPAFLGSLLLTLLNLAISSLVGPG